MASTPLQSLYHQLASITLPPAHPDAKFTNWAGTFVCAPLSTFVPETEAQCRLIFKLARLEGRTVRVAGVGHSPSDLACTREFMLRTDRLNKLLEINIDKHYVVAQGGVTLHALHAGLEARGLCMMNCGSISDQTLAGVVSTATHGSGVKYGVLSTHVQAMTLLLADGTTVRCSRSDRPDLFMASLCGLGSTGLILSVQIEVEPAFRLKEHQQTLSFGDTLRRMDELVNSAEHVRFWWFPQADSVRVSAANRTLEPVNRHGSWLWDSFLGFHVVQFALFLGRYLGFITIWAACLSSWLMSSEVTNVDKSYSIYNIDCKYQQYTTEWAIPYANTEACLRDLRRMLDAELTDPRGLRPHFPLEIRFTKEDDIWLSPGYGHRTCWIGIVQYRPYGLPVPYRKLFAQFEQVMVRHAGRPHWAKAHGLAPAELRRLYPRFDDFVRVLEDVDPAGVLRNPYVRRHIFGVAGPDCDDRAFKPRTG